MNVPQSSDAYKEEIFGPVVIVNTFKDEAEALAEANSTEFGLFCKSSAVHYDPISLVNRYQPPFTRVSSNEPFDLQKGLKQVQLESIAPSQ